MSRLLLILFLFISIGSFAQNTELSEPDLIKRVVEGTQINTLLKIDGILNDREWQYAKPVTDFVQIEPFQGKKANHKTVLSVIIDLI